MGARWFTEEWLEERSRRLAGTPPGRVVDTTPHPRKFTLVLPFPPSANRTARHTNSGVHYTPPEQKLFRTQVRDVCALISAPKLCGRLAVVIVLYPADRRRFDVDNRIKAVLDSLQRCGQYDDDEQIDDVHITRVRGTKRGECVVTVSEI
jgi:crossover junction endodeoxyribonuclease RusA